MKKCILGLIPMIMLVTMCAGGAKPVESSVEKSNGMMTLEQALKEASIRIDKRIAAKTNIAPLNFNSPHDKFSSYVLDEVTANLVDSGKLTVVDRKEIDLIRGEFDFQLSGEVGDDSMQQLGRMLGAQSIISGSLTDMGGFYRIVIRVLNVQNASVEVQYRANIVSDGITTALLTGGEITVAASNPQRTPTAQTQAIKPQENPEETSVSQQKPKREKIPFKPKFSFISDHPFGFYFDTNILGGRSYSFGIGLSIYDIIKLQTNYNYGQVPSSGRFSGTEFSGKLLANIFYLNLNYWYKTGIALGANFSYFLMENTGEYPLWMSELLGQWEIIKLDMSLFMPQWKYFKSLSIYVEPGIWFVPSDVVVVVSDDPFAWHTKFRISLGGRISLF